MKEYNTLRVKRLLVRAIDSLIEIRIEISGNNRGLVSVLDQLIQEMQDVIKDLDNEKTTLSFEDLISLSKIISCLVDLVKNWLNTLSYKFSRFSTAYNKYVRFKCQLERTLNYLELMPS